MKEVPTYKVRAPRPSSSSTSVVLPPAQMISVSTLVDRMKINGSLARVAIRSLEKEGLIKRIVHHRGQLIYSAFLVFPVPIVGGLTCSHSPSDCGDRLIERGGHL